MQRICVAIPRARKISQSRARQRNWNSSGDRDSRNIPAVYSCACAEGERKLFYRTCDIDTSNNQRPAYRIWNSHGPDETDHAGPRITSACDVYKPISKVHYRASVLDLQTVRKFFRVESGERSHSCLPFARDISQKVNR